MSKYTQLASTPASTAGDVDYKALYETTENRRKEAQSALTPVQQENARLKAQLAVGNSVPMQLPVEEQERLDDLMYSDPQAWRVEANKAEQTLKQNYEAAVETKQGEIIAEMTQEQIVQRTKDFFATKPDVDPKTVIDIMPKKLQEQLDNGDITLDEYLQKGVDLLKGATVASVLAPNSPNLSDVAGDRKPSSEAIKKQSNTDWGAALI